MSVNDTNVSKAMGVANNTKIGHRVTSARDGSCMVELLEDLVIYNSVYVYIAIVTGIPLTS